MKKEKKLQNKKLEEYIPIKNMELNSHIELGETPIFEEMTEVLGKNPLFDYRSLIQIYRKVIFGDSILNRLKGMGERLYEAGILRESEARLNASDLHMLIRLLGLTLVFLTAHRGIINLLSLPLSPMARIIIFSLITTNKEMNKTQLFKKIQEMGKPYRQKRNFINTVNYLEKEGYVKVVRGKASGYQGGGNPQQFVSLNYGKLGKIISPGLADTLHEQEVKDLANNFLTLSQFIGFRVKRIDFMKELERFEATYQPNMNHVNIFLKPVKPKPPSH